MRRRSRRLLIPGLLVGLLAVVLVATLLDRAEGADPGEATRVSTIADLRIAESSGLAVSREHEDLAYTINDSGNAAIVFAIRVSTGEVVGTTAIDDDTFTVLDAEALALQDGTLWVADTGDNARRRTDAALYAFDEPGPGEHTVRPRRYPVAYEDAPQNVEAIAVPPNGGRILLLSKLPAGGLVYQLPARLSAGAKNTAAPTERATPAFTTDAAFTHDGRHVLVRNYLFAQVRDATTWEVVRTDMLPQQPLGETIAPEASGRSYLVGSEGAQSELWRVMLELDAATPGASDEPADEPTTAPATEEPDEDRGISPVVAIAVGGAVIAVVIGIMLVRRRSRAI